MLSEPMHPRANMQETLCLAAWVFLWATMAVGSDQPQRDPVLLQVSEQMPSALRTDAALIARGARQPQESSKAFRELERVPFDPLALVERIRTQPDHTSYAMLMTLRETSPDTYASISEKTRAAVIVDMARREPLRFGSVHFEHAADGPEKGTMIYTEAGKALLELDPDTALPLMRDALRIIRSLDISAAGTRFRTCNYCHWFATALSGEEPRLGIWTDCLAMYDRISGMRAAGGAPLPQEIIDALLADAGAGKPLSESTVLWRLYDGGYNLVPLKTVIADHPDFRALHALVGLRRLSPGDFMDIDPEIRAKVLVSALGDGRFAADFGAPLYGEVSLFDLWHPAVTVLVISGIREAGLALIESGTGVMASLASLRATKGLDDDVARQARSFQDLLDVLLNKTGLPWALGHVPRGG